jgi:hypothetical protein
MLNECGFRLQGAGCAGRPPDLFHRLRRSGFNSSSSGYAASARFLPYDIYQSSTLLSVSVVQRHVIYSRRTAALDFFTAIAGSVA